MSSGGQAFVVQGQQPTNSPVVTVSGQGASRPDGSIRIQKGTVHKGLQVTGLMQVVIGLATVFLGFVHFVLNAPLARVGCPIWLGFLFLILPGVIGVAAACKRDRCMITTYMVLAILGSLATVAIVTMAAMSMGFDSQFCKYSYHPSSATCLSTRGARYAVGILICVLAFVDGVIAVVGAGMSCGALCCCTGKSTPQPGTVVYYSPGPQMNVPQQSAMINPTPAFGNPPHYEQAIHDAVVGTEGACAPHPKAMDTYDHGYEKPYPTECKLATEI